MPNPNIHLTLVDLAIQISLTVVRKAMPAAEGMPITNWERKALNRFLSALQKPDAALIAKRWSELSPYLQVFIAGIAHRTGADATLAGIVGDLPRQELGQQPKRPEPMF